MKKCLKNWRTTLAGSLTLLAVGLLWSGYITNEQCLTGIGLLAGSGFIQARDAEHKEV